VVLSACDSAALQLRTPTQCLELIVAENLKTGFAVRGRHRQVGGARKRVMPSCAGDCGLQCYTCRLFRGRKVPFGAKASARMSAQKDDIAKTSATSPFASMQSTRLITCTALAPAVRMGNGGQRRTLFSANLDAILATHSYYSFPAL
jgi:hypothetical protein